LLYSCAPRHADGTQAGNRTFAVSEPGASSSSSPDNRGDTSTIVDLETAENAELSTRSMQAHGTQSQSIVSEDGNTSAVRQPGPKMQQDQQYRTGDSARGGHRHQSRHTLKVAARTVVASLRHDEDQRHSDAPKPPRPSSGRTEKESSKPPAQPPAQRWGSSTRSTRLRVSHSPDTSSNTSTSGSTSVMHRSTYAGAANRPRASRPASAGGPQNDRVASGSYDARRVRIVAKRKGGKMVFEEVPLRDSVFAT
jgi:hypothetical protein